MVCWSVHKLVENDVKFYGEIIRIYLISIESVGNHKKSYKQEFFKFSSNERIQ